VRYRRVVTVAALLGAVGPARARRRSLSLGGDRTALPASAGQTRDRTAALNPPQRRPATGSSAKTQPTSARFGAGVRIAGNFSISRATGANFRKSAASNLSMTPPRGCVVSATRGAEGPNEGGMLGWLTRRGRFHPRLWTSVRRQW
jgi:hypothetical protein